MVGIYLIRRCSGFRPVLTPSNTTVSTFRESGWHHVTGCFAPAAYCTVSCLHLMSLHVTLYLWYWHFLNSRSHIVALHWKWIPMFVTTLSVPVNHEPRTYSVVTFTITCHTTRSAAELQIGASAHSQQQVPRGHRGEEGMWTRKAIGRVCDFITGCFFKDAVIGSGCIASPETDLQAINPKGFGRNKSWRNVILWGPKKCDRIPWYPKEHCFFSWFRGFAHLSF